MAAISAAVVERRARALDERLPAALAGEVEGIHQARVASRRLRAAVPVMAPSDVRPRKLLRRLRRITRAFGPVRELDVALGTVGELAGRWPAAADAREPFEARLRAARARAFAEARRELSDHRARRVTEHVEELVDRLAAHNEAPWTEALAAHLSRQAEGLVAAVDQAGALYAIEALHAVRIAGKRLRYALELADETRLARVRGPIRRLKAIQDILGRLHDLDVLASYARELEIEDPLPARGMNGLLRGITRECRLLHAQYVRQAPALVDLAGQVSARVARVAGRGVEPGPRGREVEG